MAELFLISPQGERLPLRGQQLTVGRDPHCELVLDDPSVSREHAVLIPSGHLLTIRDNGSRNGTFVDGQRLAQGESRTAKPGQSVGFGNYTLRLELDAKSSGANSSGARSPEDPRSGDITFAVSDLLPEQRASAGPEDALPSLLADVMYRAQGALFPGQPLQTLHEALLHLCLAFVPAHFAAVHITEGDVKRGLLRDGTPVSRDIALSTALRNSVLRDKRTVLMRDRATDAQLKHSASLMNAGVTSAIAAPIFDGDDIMGLLYVTITDGSHALTEVDAAVCTVLASVAGTALLGARMMHDLLVQNEALRAQLRELGVEPRQ